MDAAADPLALESLLAFWAEAGVDACLEDVPVDRLAPRAVRAELPPPRAAATPASNGAAIPPSELAGEAQAVAEAAGNLAALEAAFAAFDLRELRPGGARVPVWRRGSETPSLLVIGGLPGVEESDTGGAFAGAAGRLLDRMLTSIGMDDAALRLHASPWRSPGDREPTTNDAARLRPFLWRAVALTRPAAVLIVGDQAARVLLDRAEGVLKLRGRPLDDLSQVAASDPLPVVVTFGPAFLLRQPRLKAQAWADLLSLAAAVARVRNGP